MTCLINSYLLGSDIKASIVWQYPIFPYVRKNFASYSELYENIAEIISYKLNVLLTCIIVYQNNKTNMINILFSLLRIEGLYMFQALLAHPQEALHKRHLVYCVRVMSVGCTRTGVLLQSWCSQLM
jgi:hypothetical protein